MMVDDVDMPSWMKGMNCKRCSHLFQRHWFYAFHPKEDGVIHAHCKNKHCECTGISIKDGQVMYD